MTTTATLEPSQSSLRNAALNYWTQHDFYSPETVALGIDIGIEGIGIAVRKGTELLYCKTLLVDLPEAQALAARRAFRASRHARKNRRTRMPGSRRCSPDTGSPGWMMTSCHAAILSCCATAP